MFFYHFRTTTLFLKFKFECPALEVPAFHHGNSMTSCKLVFHTNPGMTLNTRYCVTNCRSGSYSFLWLREKSNIGLSNSYIFLFQEVVLLIRCQYITNMTCYQGNATLEEIYSYLVNQRCDKYPNLLLR